MNTLLELNKINYTYHTLENETLALKDISFSVREGEFVAIVGPSGCGKSTMLHLISGLLKPDKGTITLRGNLALGSGIGYMLQKDELLEWRTVYENITLGLEIQHKLNTETRTQIWRLLSAYDLNRFSSAHPSELSGGMRQRVALIRTLVLEPDILLLDEPFSALDYQTRLNVGNDIGKIIRKERKTAILVTHDLSEAISLADRIIVLTKRPATVCQTIQLSFDMKEFSPLNRRNAPEFKKYFHLIWKELNHDERIQ